MATVSRHFEFLKAQQGEMAAELKRYAAIESYSRDKAGIDRVGSLVIKAWQELGFATETIAQAESGNHIIARRTGKGRGHLLCHMHLDTTDPMGTITGNPVEERDGRVYGPGTIDMKGGWVVLLGAFRALRAARWDGLASATIFICGDEELGSPTGRPHIEKAAQHADWQVIMEPAREGGNLLISRGVVGAIYFTIGGKFALATSGQGASAIVEAAHKILAIQKLVDASRKRLLNVGLVEGGSARQMVATKAWLSIDLRAPDQKEAEELVAAVREVADKVDVPGTRTVMSGGITRPAFPRHQGNLRMLHLAQEVGRELGLDIQEAPTTPGGSDGSFGAAMGIASLDGLGPRGGRADRGQYVITDSLPERAALLAGVIERLPNLLDRR
ncbi:MAG: M20/M25/M40 family metallo-hydrolase [Acetobacteraceae bacterium]